MKVCQYCNAENDDNAKTCCACGASEFNHKCNNCGTVYHDGGFCPQCGTKAGQKAKTCPNCGTEYYTNACPNCGYNGSKSNNTSAPNYVQPSNQPSKVEYSSNPVIRVMQQSMALQAQKTELEAKKAELAAKKAQMYGDSGAATKKGRSCLSTCLWILGWIYIFPVPVTILVRRNQNMSKILKIIIIAAAWFAYLFFFYYAAQRSKTNQTTAATSQILPLLTHLG